MKIYKKKQIGDVCPDLYVFFIDALDTGRIVMYTEQYK